MLFRRLFLCALLVGWCAGLVSSVVQHWQVVPIIAAAETFESRAPGPQADHHAAGSTVAPHTHGHAHDEAAWEPQEGFSRTAWTVVADVLGATGFALLLIPAMAWWDFLRGGRAASWRTGLLWGAVGWLCCFVWPAIGMSPGLPGEAAASLQSRQAWWLLAVSCAISGFALLLWAKDNWRWLGLPLLALPFFIGAPQIEGLPFAGYPSDAALQMALLKSRFVIGTTWASALEWLVLGVACGVAVARWVRPLLLDSPSSSGHVGMHEGIAQQRPRRPSRTSWTR